LFIKGFEGICSSVQWGLEHRQLRLQNRKRHVQRSRKWNYLKVMSRTYVQQQMRFALVDQTFILCSMYKVCRHSLVAGSGLAPTTLWQVNRWNVVTSQAVTTTKWSNIEETILVLWFCLALHLFFQGATLLIPCKDLHYLNSFLSLFELQPY
jgi:hypothetical protein